MLSSTPIIFFGTSEFAVPILETLFKHGYKIPAVITRPDAPAGRKKILTPPPVKGWIQSYKLGITNQELRILQPQRLKENKEFIQQLRALNPELFVVAAYGKIIPKEMLEIPEYGALNIHPSLLPKYRGPTPIQNAILNGDTETGVTIMLMDEEMDHGDIIATIRHQLSTINYYPEIHNELAQLGAQLLIENLPKWIEGEIKPKEQDHTKATYTKKFSREDGKINWVKPAEQIYNQIRALNPEPGTWTTYNLKRKIKSIKEGGKEQVRILKILKARQIFTSPTDVNLKPGVVFEYNKAAAVSCGSGALELKEVQLEGKKMMSISDFLNGFKEFICSQLAS